MAGKPGRSGGARANTGGSRPGAGRKPTPPTYCNIPKANTPLEWLKLVMADDAIDLKMRLAAAVAMMPYCHGKAEGGVKDAQQAAAKKAASGKFAAAPAPLRAVK